MSKLSRGIVTSLPVVGAFVAVAAAGCQSIIGIHDVSLEESTGGSTTTSSSASTASVSVGVSSSGSTVSVGSSVGSSSVGSSSSSATAASSSSSGTGGQSAASFALSIRDISVNVPYGGLNDLNVEIIPSGGFSGVVDVTVQGAPAGFVSVPLTLPAGTTTGQLEVGAQTTLVLGTTFTLTLVATSGSISKTATVPAVVTGKPGALDQSFNGGLVAQSLSALSISQNLWGGFYTVQELSTGKILAGGLAAGKLGGGGGIAARYLPDGTLDTTFATTGFLLQDVPNQASDLPSGFVGSARELDGTMVFVGSANANDNQALTPYNVYLFRYNDDGTLNAISQEHDTGVDIINLGGNETMVTGVPVPDSTDMVVAGSQDGKLFVARIEDVDSVVAPSFAAPNGFVVPALGGTGSTAGALAFDGAGNVVVTGSVTTAATGADVVLLRLTAAGALDTSFGTGGVVTLARPGDQLGSSVIVQPDGAIVVAADTIEGGTRQLLVQRFLPSGTPDPSFGTAGVVLAPLGGANPNGTVYGSVFKTAWMVQMLDGRLVVAGNGTLGGVSGPVLARFRTDGSPDPTFGTNGELAVFVGTYGMLGAMSLTSAGKLLLAGTNSGANGTTFIARVWN